MASGERPGATSSKTFVPPDRSSPKEATVFIDPFFVGMLLVLRAAYDKIPDNIPPPTMETEISAILDRVKDTGVLEEVKGFDPPKRL